MNKFKENILQNKWLYLTIIVAAFLRFYKLNFQSLWLDEIYTLNISSPHLSFSEFNNEVVKREGFPHLYFLILKFLYAVFGYSPLVARSLSAFAGTVAIYAIYILGKELHSKKAGLYAAILLTVSEYHIYISQDARPYILYFLFTILSYYRLAIFIKNHSLKNAIYYGLFTGLMLNFNFFAFINTFAQAVFIIICLFFIPKNQKIKLFKNAVIAGLISLLLIVSAYKILQKLLAANVFWVPGPQSDSYEKIFNNILGESEIVSFIILPLVIHFLFTLFNKKELLTYNYFTVIKFKPTFSFLVLFFWFFIVFSFLMISSYGKTSYLLTRYFTSIIPVVFLILALSIKAIKNKVFQYLMLFVLVFYSLVNLFFAKKHYSVVHHPQFREAAQYILEQNTKNETIYSSQKYWFDYFLNNANSKQKITAKDINSLVKDLKNHPEKRPTFWMLGAFKNKYEPTNSTKVFLDKNYYIQNKFDGYQAWVKRFVPLYEAPKTVSITKFNLINKEKEGSPIIHEIEEFIQNQNKIYVKGYAYIKNQNANTSQTQIVLVKDTLAYRCYLKPIERQDVTKLNPKYNLDNSGFQASLNTIKLKKGQYKLGIYITDTKTKLEGIVLTDMVYNKK